MKQRITLQEIVMGIGFTFLLVGIFSIIAAGIIVKCSQPQNIWTLYHNTDIVRYLWQHKLFTGSCLLSIIVGIGLSVLSEDIPKMQRKRLKRQNNQKHI